MMIPKILHWSGVAACILLIISCFLPWAYFADPHIPLEAHRTFTGFFSYQNNYGKPGKLMVTTAVIVLILMFTPRVWAKRINLFLCAILVGYAIKTYILFVSCYNAFCPEKKAGIFLMLISTMIMMAAAALPRLELKAPGTEKPE